MGSDAPHDELKVCLEATLALSLARTALPFARTRNEEAERWLRVMRVYGQVGAALQALGVAARPLERPSDEASGRERRSTADTVDLVTFRAMDFARQSGANRVGTVHLLFGVLDVYGWAFDQELYRRGTSRNEIFEQLAAMPAGAQLNEAAA